MEIDYNELKQLYKIGLWINQAKKDFDFTFNYDKENLMTQKMLFPDFKPKNENDKAGMCLLTSIYNVYHEILTESEIRKIQNIVKRSDDLVSIMKVLKQLGYDLFKSYCIDQSKPITSSQLGKITNNILHAIKQSIDLGYGIVFVYQDYFYHIRHAIAIYDKTDDNKYVFFENANNEVTIASLCIAKALLDKQYTDKFKSEIMRNTITRKMTDEAINTYKDLVCRTIDKEKNLYAVSLVNLMTSFRFQGILYYTGWIHPNFSELYPNLRYNYDIYN